MKTIKTLTLSVVAITMLALTFITSCTKDTASTKVVAVCDTLVCQNGGSCVNNACSCTLGYEGSRCQTLSRAKMIKTWSVVETPMAGGTPSAPYAVTIAAGGSVATAIVIGNIGTYTCSTGGTLTFNAALTSATAFAINDSACGYRITGNGTYNTSTNKISGSYHVTYTTGSQHIDDYNFVME